MNININQVQMYKRALLALFRQQRSNGTFRYSTSNAPPPPNKTQAQKQPQKNINQSQIKTKKEDDQYDEDNIPLQKENRNTIGWWIYRFFFWGGFSLLTYNIYLVFNHSKKTKVEDQHGAVPIVIDVAKNIVNNFNDFTEFITQPPSKKLLADTVHPDFHPKTLILNLTGTIISSEYIFGKGNKITLRPGLVNLLNRLVSKYEIIIFAEQDSAFIMNSIQSIDPKHQFIQGYFGKESMVWRGGHYIKDMKYMNRDLRKIVVIDRNIQNVKNQPDNVILLPEFSGQKDDIQLNKLLVLLQNLASPQIVDVRKTLKNIGQKPVDIFYEKIKEKEKKLQQKQKSFNVFGSKTNSFKKNKEQDQF